MDEGRAERMLRICGCADPGVPRTGTRESGGCGFCMCLLGSCNFRWPFYTPCLPGLLGPVTQWKCSSSALWWRKKLASLATKKRCGLVCIFFFNQACLKVKWPAENLPTSSRRGLGQWIREACGLTIRSNGFWSNGTKLILIFYVHLFNFQLSAKARV